MQYATERRTMRWMGLVAAALVCLAHAGMAFAAPDTTASTTATTHPTAAKLLPENVGLFITIADVPELVKRFQNTATGRMIRDPQLRPLLEQTYGAVNEAAWGNLFQGVVGMSISELLAIPQGEVTFALVVSEEKSEPDVVAMLDAGPQIGVARRLLAKMEEFQHAKGMTRTEQTIGGTKIVIYERDDLFFFEKANTICLTSTLDAAKSVLSAWNGASTRTLADNPKFATIVSRCRGSKEVAPQIVAYVDPIMLVKLSMRSGQGGTGMQVAMAMLPTLGLDGLLAVGGSLTMDAGPYDSIFEAHLLLDNPRRGVLEVIAFAPGDFAPEPWVPADVASYMTLNWDFRRSVQKIASLYDSFTGEGFFQTRVADGFTKNSGIDFNKELIDQLDGRASLVQWIEQPITLTSQHYLLGLRLKNPKPVEESLQRSFQKHERFLTKQMYAGRTYYEATPRRPDGEPIRARNQPHFYYGVMDNYLLTSTQPGVFRQALLTAAEPAKSLGSEPDFMLIAGKIQRLAGGTKPAMVSFDRPEEGLRFLYGLATADRTRELLRRQAENNPFFKSLDTSLQQHPLPPFAVLSRYFAPGGSFVVDDETGLHWTGFSLRRKLD